MNDRADPHDFEQIVLRHLNAAYNLARWLVRNPTTAEDVLQDALLGALKGFARFRGGCERAWLLRIVHNVACSYLKAGRPGMEISLDAGTGSVDEDGSAMDLPDSAPNPETALALQQHLSQVDRLLSELPFNLRECLILRELEELSYKDIAQITGVPVGTVMSRLSRARDRFRELSRAGARLDSYAAIP
jgi:RNA polymerase sigma-70 factor, ECF subfamily